MENYVAIKVRTRSNEMGFVTHEQNKIFIVIKTVELVLSKVIAFYVISLK